MSSLASTMLRRAARAWAAVLLSVLLAGLRDGASAPAARAAPAPAPAPARLRVAATPPSGGAAVAAGGAPRRLDSIDCPIKFPTGSTMYWGDGIALCGGDDFYEGMVLVFVTTDQYGNGNWRPICDLNWGINDAHVACRQLFGDTSYALEYYHDSHFGFDYGHSTPAGWNFGCNGDEAELLDCYYSSTGLTSGCWADDNAGVKCSSGPYPSAAPQLGPTFPGGMTIALEDGPSMYEGRVNVYNEGAWGFVGGCWSGEYGYTWSQTDGNVVCRQLFGEAAYAEAVCWGCYDDVYGSEQDVRTDDDITVMNWVRCVGNETRLQDCPHSTSQTYLSCSVGVTCAISPSLAPSLGPSATHAPTDTRRPSLSPTREPTATSAPSFSTVPTATFAPTTSLSLEGGSTAFEGWVLVTTDDGARGAVCDDSWGLYDGHVVCWQLFGSGSYALEVKTNSYFGWDSDYDFVMDDVACSGSVSRLQDCSYNANDNCGNTEGAGVICAPVPDPTPRPTAPPSIAPGDPTAAPTPQPTPRPTEQPSVAPVLAPAPTPQPTQQPSVAPGSPTAAPVLAPTAAPVFAGPAPTGASAMMVVKGVLRVGGMSVAEAEGLEAVFKAAIALASGADASWIIVAFSTSRRRLEDADVVNVHYFISAMMSAEEAPGGAG